MDKKKCQIGSRIKLFGQIRLENSDYEHVHDISSFRMCAGVKHILVIEIKMVTCKEEEDAHELSCLAYRLRNSRLINE